MFIWNVVVFLLILIIYLLGVRRNIDGRLLVQPLLGFSFFQWINNFVYKFDDLVVAWMNFFFVALTLLVIIFLVIKKKNIN
ncbi:hypothetical protein SAMN04489710_102111 [Paracidovorax konjaci]|uniref:Uncharacterized protein n=1 Tax=Paracidovorax konjaci TaxID=32040 RepID=A0A1I1SCD9_9BURK|nr:hypothetical protein SAMN04489710_102111 [Paracidovorax konjaci]